MGITAAITSGTNLDVTGTTGMTTMPPSATLRTYPTAHYPDRLSGALCGAITPTGCRAPCAR